MNLPTTLEEINDFINNEVQENLHLDYKESLAIDRSKRSEIAKDVSAFANSDGGIIIYGIVENNNLPVRVDTGVNHALYSREWIEQIISSHITPKIDDILISAIPASTTHSIYAVKVPKSFRGPHQASDKRYYKRFNFQSVPMEDYEITDIKNRRRSVPPLIDVRVQVRRRMAYLAVTNVGEETAENVLFELPSELNKWINERQIKVFTRGIKYFPPEKTYTFIYGFLPQLLHEGEHNPAEFDIVVSYKHPLLENRVSESFHIDLMDHWGASTLSSEISEQGKEIKDAIKELTKEINALNRHVTKIVTIAGVTGLDLSITTLRNLRHIQVGDGQLEKINPEGLDIDVFVEVLGVDFETAAHLSNFFWRGNESIGLEEIPGMTNELLEKIKSNFELKAEAED